jgi:hypothetical protein
VNLITGLFLLYSAQGLVRSIYPVSEPHSTPAPNQSTDEAAAG